MELVTISPSFLTYPNPSGSLFLSAKVGQFVYLPQGGPERTRRALRMVARNGDDGFSNCSNHGECEAVCPKKIPIENIAKMRREIVTAAFD